MTMDIYPKIPNKGRTSNKMGAPLFWTSDGIISKTVCPIYLKIDVLIVHIGHSLHTEFQVNRMNHFRDIAIESWQKKILPRIKGAPFIRYFRVITELLNFIAIVKC